MKNLSYIFLISTTFLQIHATFHSKEGEASIVPLAASESLSNQRGRRRIAIGDFDRFNELFDGASITTLNDQEFEVSETILFTTLTLWITNLRCFDISIGDVQVSHVRNSDQDIEVSVDILEVDATCEIDYRYKYGFLDGDGVAKITTDNNSFSTLLGFASADFNTSPPTSATVEQCTTDFEITNMEFEGDFLSDAVEIFEEMIRDTVEEQVEKVACDELSSMDTLVEEMLTMMDETLEVYQGDLGASVTDPLYLEQTTDLPAELLALNFQETENIIGDWFNQALDAVDSFLGSMMPDPADPNSDSRGMGINVLIRDNLLDENDALVMDISKLGMDSTLFQGHDKLTETTITLNQVSIFGLDSFTKFDPLNRIGKYTLQNELTWESLKFEMDVTVDILPSSLEDAMLHDATSEGISERIMIDFAVDNLDVIASLFLVIDQQALGAMELGSLLQTDNLIPCVLSVLHSIDLSGLHIEPQSINPPTLKGFVSVGIDRIITNAVEAAFEMYSGTLDAIIPNIFQTTIRDFLNTEVIDTYVNDPLRAACPAVEKAESFVDFRDLLLAPEAAIENGGSGNQQYGDLVYTIMDLLKSNLLTTSDKVQLEENVFSASPSSLPINDVLIAPITKKLSGEEGTLKLADDVFGIISNAATQLGMDVIELRAFGPVMKDLDTFIEPLELLEPTMDNGQVLDNTMTFSAGDDSLLFSMNALMAVQGDPSLEMHNEFELALGLGGSQLLGSFMAKMDADSFLSFPLRDIANKDCWLATLSTPLQNGDGDFEFGNGTGLSLESIAFTIPSMQFQFSCKNCTSSGLNLLPELLERLEATGVSDTMEKGLLDLGLDLARSDIVQAYLDRLVVEGAMRCPHSPTFVDLTAQSDQPVPSLPSLTYAAQENLVFMASVFVHIITVVISESHASYNPQLSNPLEAQTELDAKPEKASYIDFSSLDESFGEFVDVGVEQLKDYLTATVSDSNGPDGEDLRINNLLRNGLLDEHGILELNFDDLSIEGQKMEIALKQIRVTGLDTVTTFDVLDAISPQTLQNTLKLKQLGVQVVVSLMGNEEEGQSGRKLQTQEDITMSLALGEVELSVALLLAADLDMLGSLQLSSMLEIKNILPCLLTAAKASKLTQLQFFAGSIKEFSVEGFRSNELATAASESSRLILEEYGDLILSSMPGVFDTTVRTLLNNWIAYFMEEWPSTAQCTSASFLPTNVTSFVDFRDLLLPVATAKEFGGTGTSPYGDLFRTVVGYLQDLVFKVDQSTGLSKINDILIGPLTRSQSETTGSLVYPGDLFTSDNRVKVGGLDAMVELRASNARIDNLDTVGSPLALLEAIVGDPHSLNNTATIGVGDRPLRMSTQFLIALTGDDDASFRNELDISLDLAAVNLVLQAMMKVAKNRFFEFPLRDVLDLNCWLALLPAPELDSRGVRLEDEEATAALTNLAATIASLNLKVSCVDCSSPRMSELTELLSSAEAQEDLTEVTNMVLDYVTELVGGTYLQVQIDRMLNDAARRCPHSSAYQPDVDSVEYEALTSTDIASETTFLVLLGGVVLGLVVAAVLVTLIVKCIVRHRHQKFLGSLQPHKLNFLLAEQNRKNALESSLNENTRSMFTSPKIPLFVRWSIPLVLLGNIAFFLSGHLSLGATVNIEAEIAGEKIRVDKFFDFSMAKSTIDIWNAGGHALAILILIFSCIWPYSKLLVTLFLWFIPPSRVSVSRRGSILVWLDALGKWSMIDIFVLVISIAAFRVSIVSPPVGFLPEDFYSLDLMVVPLWGLYANMIAQLLTQVTSHFIIHYHRLVVHSAKAKSVERNDVTTVEELSAAEEAVDRPIQSTDERLCDHKFCRLHRCQRDGLVVRNWVGLLLWALSFTSVVMIILGSTLPAFSLEIFGLIGVAVESGQNFEDAVTEHSVFTVVKLMFEEASFLGTAGDYIGLGTLCVLLVLTVLVVPIVQCLVLLRQWFSSLTTQQRTKLGLVIEILQAWQYAEVYLIAIFVASWQLGPISQFMVNTYCDSLKDMFSEWVYYGILKEKDAQCFSVESSIEEGFFFLAVGSVLLALINTFVNKAVIQYYADISDAETRRRYDGMADKDSDPGTVETVEGDADLDESKIAPVPVLFSDTFRWMLRSELASPSCSTTCIEPFGVEQEAIIASFDEPTSMKSPTPDDLGVIEEEFSASFCGPSSLEDATQHEFVMDQEAFSSSFDEPSSFMHPSPNDK